MPSMLRPEETPQGVVGITTLAAGAVTRPADTNAYTAGDAISGSTTAGTLIQIPVARKQGASGIISSVQVVDSANQATKADLELWLFTGDLATHNDNAAFAPTDAELTDRVGIVDLGSSPDVGLATAGAGGNCAYQSTNVNLPFRCAGGERNLYGALVVRNAYTPVSGEVFTVILGVLQD